MNAALVIIFGAIIGFACYSIYGSGFGLWWDIALGIAGSTIASAVISTLYMLNNFGRPDVIGLNWYSMTVGAIGALLVIYAGLLLKKISPTLKIK